MSPRCYLVSFYVVVLIAVLFCSFCAAASAPDSPLYAAYYVSDAVDYAGNIFLYVRNPADEPMSISEITIDGESIGTIWPTDEGFLEPDVRDEYIQIENDQLAWYRVFPNPIPGAGVAEVILRLVPEASRASECTLGVTLEGQDAVETTVPLEDPAFSFEYVGIEENLDVLHLYTRTLPGVGRDISRVEVDGQPVDADLHRVYRGLSYARVELPRPWKRASYHSVGIGTADELRAVLIRALPTPAPLGIMGNTHERALEEYRNKLFEASIAFTPASIDTYERLARYDLRGAYIYRRSLEPEERREPVYYDRVDYGEGRDLREIKEHPALWAYFLEDEPDGRYHRTDLSRWSIARDVERANQFCRIFDPETPVYLQMNHGGYPRNMYIWGQIPDYICTHAYTLGSQRVINATQDHVIHTRNASRPRPFYYLNCGYCSRGDSRVYDPMEMHLEVYTALAEGVKSLQWYPAHGDRGLLKHPKMWTAVGAMNGVLRQVLPLVSIGNTIGSPRTQGGDLLSRAILCGDKAIAVVLVNRDFTADAESFELHPAEATVRVRLPAFMDAEGIAEVNFPEETVAIPAEISPSSVEFETTVQAGKVLIIYADDALLDQMRIIHDRCQEQFVPSPEAE